MLLLLDVSVTQLELFVELPKNTISSRVSRYGWRLLSLSAGTSCLVFRPSPSIPDGDSTYFMFDFIDSGNPETSADDVSLEGKKKERKASNWLTDIVEGRNYRT
jgi:hypothetical protein